MEFSEYLTGYQDPLASPLFDGNDLRDHPLFWPAFVSMVTGIGELPPAAFNLDPVDLDVFVDELVTPDRWPVFSLPLAEGMQCDIVVRDEDILGFLFDHLITGGPLDRLIQIAGYINNDPFNPGISWQELIAAAQQPDPQHSTAERLLLLLPAGGDANLPANANQVVADALSTVGAVQRQKELAEDLLSYANENEYQWISEKGTTLCTREESVRRKGGELTESELHLITRAFRPEQEP